MTGILQQIMSTMEQTRSVSVLDSVSMIGFAALLVLGVINCVLGYRLLRFWMMLFGFLIGGGIGLGVAYTMGIQEKYMYAVIMIGVGILLAVIAFLSYKVGIFIIGAGIGDHEDLDELGRIILVLDGAYEVGDHGFLVMRRDKEGITVEFFGLGRRDLATKSANDKEDNLVQKADREQRDDNLVENHDGCVGL